MVAPAFTGGIDGDGNDLTLNFMAMPHSTVVQQPSADLTSRRYQRNNQTTTGALNATLLGNITNTLVLDQDWQPDISG